MTETVGIVNLTPDSFSDGGKYFSPGGVVNTGLVIGDAAEMLGAGAAFLDIGAEATNPWAKPISAGEEWARLQPILPKLMDQFAGRLSIDTYHPQTAQKALAMGQIIINDVMTFRDPAMREVAAQYRARCIIGHAPLAAYTMHDVHHGVEQIDSVQQVVDETMQQVRLLEETGLPKKNIILDPGIGFGKTMRINWALLEFPRYVRGYDVMVGPSRKRFLAHDQNTGKKLYDNDEEKKKLQNDDKRNLLAASMAIKAGVRYLRVHDVRLYQPLINS